MNRSQMTAPFAEEELRQFEGRGGKTMTFIEDETVMDRLDAGYGYGNWQVQVEETRIEGVVKVRLGVRENGEWAWYEDFGYPNQKGGDELKEAVSDGIRRCGRYLGIARDLYRKATYEPGGALGPKRGKERPAPPRLPAREDPATVDPPPPGNDPYVENEELIGRIRRGGIARKGSSEQYKLESRQGPDGHVIGFRLEVGPEKHIPQCVVEGPLGEALFQATGGKPSVLAGVPTTVAGILYYVKTNRVDPETGRAHSWYRLHVDRIETRINGLDVILPADVEPELPGPPDDVSLVGETPEAPSQPLGLVPEEAA